MPAETPVGSAQVQIRPIPPGACPAIRTSSITMVPWSGPDRIWLVSIVTAARKPPWSRETGTGKEVPVWI